MAEERDPPVTPGELADWFGVTTQTLRNLVAKGVIKKGPGGHYPLRTSLRDYLAHLRGVAAGRVAKAEDENAVPDLTLERALLARTQREGHSMKNAILRGDLLPVEDVEAVVGAVFDATRAKLLAVPTKLAPRCVGVRDLITARELLTVGIHDALDELSATEAVVQASTERALGSIRRGAFGDEVDAEAEAAAAPDRKPVGGRISPFE